MSESQRTVDVARFRMGIAPTRRQEPAMGFEHAANARVTTNLAGSSSLRKALLRLWKNGH